MADFYPIPTPAAVGQLSLLTRPRGGDWLCDDIARWAHHGIDTVVSLLESDEETALDLTAEAPECIDRGIVFISQPITDRGIPESSSAYLELVQDLANRIAGGHSVGIHCRMSIGRAPLVAAGVLTALGVAPETALAQVGAARGRSVPETDEQRRWFLGLPVILAIS